jgi:hypothetical protein
MSSVISNEFVVSVIADFLSRYPHLRCHVPQIVDDDGHVWISCGQLPCRPRLKSLLTFGVSHDCITVAFDGRTRPILVRPPHKDGDTARREAFEIFDNLLTERFVAFSYVGGEYDFIEWIARESVSTRTEALGKDMRACGVEKWTAKIRSWSGRYDDDAA